MLSVGNLCVCCLSMRVNFPRLSYISSSVCKVMILTLHWQNRWLNQDLRFRAHELCVLRPRTCKTWYNMGGKSRFWGRGQGAPVPFSRKPVQKPGIIWADVVNKQFILCHDYYTAKSFRKFAGDFTKIFRNVYSRVLIATITQPRFSENLPRTSRKFFHNVYSHILIKFLFPKFPDNIFSDCVWHFGSWTQA